MSVKPAHDVGFLKRVDLPNGQSKLVDGFGETVATLQTAMFPGWSKNEDVSRFRLTETEPV